MFMSYQKTTIKISIANKSEKYYCEVIIGELRIITEEPLLSYYH
jgi:hypothetical protein